MPTFVGYLLRWERLEADLNGRGKEEAFFSALISATKAREGVGGRHLSDWRLFGFESHTPLMGEDPGFIKNDPFVYPFLVRFNRVTGNIIIGGGRYSVVDAVIEAFDRNSAPSLRRIHFDVVKAVYMLMWRDFAEFAITSLMADVPGHGAALRSIALHGDDVGRANFLREELPSFMARQIGLRPRDSSYECVRLGNNGTIQFNDARLRELENCLAFANDMDLYII